MKSERFGWILIAASLAVVAALIALLYSKQSGLHRDQVRSQGVALARALSGAELGQLVRTAGERHLVNTFVAAQASDSLAYAAVVSKSGARLYEFTSPGAIVPAASAH